MYTIPSYQKHLKDYCSHSTFDGVHYIADEKIHWTERWLWVALLALSVYGSAALTISAWETFLTNPISFGVETNYLDWDTKMPTVAICEQDNNARIYEVSDALWTPDHLPDLEDVLKEIAYFRGALYYTLDHCYKYVHPLCPLTNLSYYANLVRSTCLQILTNCSYNGVYFDCCEYFQYISTDLGNCYILNSIQTQNPIPYPMISNINNKRGVIKMDVLAPSKMFTIGEDEIPGVTVSDTATFNIRLGYRVRRHVTVRNIENDPLVIETTPEKRACRFHHETEEDIYPHYSLSACNIACRKKAQLQVCGCNDHLMPQTTEQDHCNLTGLICLSKNFNELTTLKPIWSPRPGLACNCLPSCTESVITNIKNEEIFVRSFKKKKSVVEIILAYLPTERFKRNVVRSSLDLVVSFGGTTGLFLGASVLSFVELIFYLSVRYFTDVLRAKRRRHHHLKNNANTRIQQVYRRNPILPILN